MLLTIFIAWLALAALAVFFMYCCSRVSNGATPALTDETDDDFAGPPPGPVTGTGTEPRFGKLYNA